MFQYEDCEPGVEKYKVVRERKGIGGVRASGIHSCGEHLELLKCW